MLLLKYAIVMIQVADTGNSSIYLLAIAGTLFIRSKWCRTLVTKGGKKMVNTMKWFKDVLGVYGAILTWKEHLGITAIVGAGTSQGLPILGLLLLDIN